MKIAALFRRTAVLGALALAGCAHYPANAPLARYDPSAGYRFNPPSGDPEGTSVLLFFSGGGMRAAALSYGTLRELDRIHPFPDHPGQALIADVDLISAVSGGSFTAAYYCLHGERTFPEFESRFLKRNVEGALIRDCLAPPNWFRLASPNFGRSDLAAEYYGRRLFDGATFGDLARNGSRPYLVINATDAAVGIGFGFTQDQFDLIYSDLSSYPIGRAVAASSAVPILLTPITLRNYSGKAGRADPAWLPKEDRDLAAAAAPSDLWRLLRSYLDGNERPYLHLVDGGFSDNLGLRGIFEVSVAVGGLDKLLESIRARHIRRLVFIVVDASADRTSRYGAEEAVPGMFRVLGTLGDSLEKHAGAALVDLIRRRLSAEGRAAAERARIAGGVPPIPEDEAGPTFQSYFITVGFDDLADPAERKFFETLPSNFNLPPETIDRITDAGGRLLRRSPDFQRLLRDLGGPAK